MPYLTSPPFNGGTIADPLEFTGTGSAPSVSAANSAKLYADGTGTLLLSMNTGAYVAVATAASGGGWTRTGTVVALTNVADAVSIGVAAGSVAASTKVDFLGDSTRKNFFLIAGPGAAGAVGGDLDMTSGAGNGAGAGGLMAVRGGIGGATAQGGSILIISGVGGVTSGAGGDTVIQSASATTDGAGGQLNLQTGNGVGGNNLAGTMALSGGTSAGAGTGPTITIKAGTGGVTNGTGGQLILRGGQSGAAAGTGGSILFTTARTATGTTDTTAVLISADGSISCPGAGATSERFGLNALAGATSTVVGSAATAAGGISIVLVGRGATGAGVADSIGIGDLATVNAGNNIIGIGSAVNPGFATTFVVGAGGVASASNQVVFGSTTSSFTTCYIGGEGPSDATPPAVTWRVTDSSANTVAGSALTIRPGSGQTSGAGGALTTQGGTGGVGGVGGANLINGGAAGQAAQAGGVITFSTSATGSGATLVARAQFRADTNAATATLCFGSANKICWTSSANNPAGTADTGIVRGVLESGTVCIRTSDAGTGTGSAVWAAAGVRVQSGNGFEWSNSSTDVTRNGDTSLTRPAVGVVAINALPTGAVELRAEAPPTVGSNGSTLTVTAGSGGATSGNGALLTLQGGPAPTSGNGGGVSVLGRNGAASNNVGGALTFTAGSSIGSGIGAAITATAGAGGATGAGGAIIWNAGAGGATSGSGGAITATAGAGVNGNAVGGVLTLSAGTSNGSGIGSAATIQGGGGGATGAGGTAQLVGGPGGGTSGTGGVSQVIGGTGVGTNAVGGQALVESGTGNGAGSSGAATLRSGTPGATGASGAVTINSASGGATSGDSGAVAATSGASTSGNTGAIALTTGNAAAGNSGNITLTTGTASGTRGSITLDGLGVVVTPKVTSYNAITTTGWGVPSIYGAGRSTAQAAAVATVATYTVGAADGSFDVCANVRVTTATNHAFTVTCAYTDEVGTARTLTLSFTLVAGGTLVTSVANANGTVPYMGIPQRIRCQAATAITIATTGTFTTVVYNVEGTIVQVA